jgi:hypothetical protein
MKRATQVQHIAASQLHNTYKVAPKLWRHSLHTICSRVAMFPPQLTHYFIERYSSKGDVVADVWAGVGTVPLQAGLDGRFGVGSDISPEARIVMDAKIHPLTVNETKTYLDAIEHRMRRMPPRGLDAMGRKIGIQSYYYTRTLQEVLKLRDLLRRDRKSHAAGIRRRANFVTALMLGILHGDRTESLSINMDCSKAFSPTHISAMQRKYPSRYRPQYRSVISCLRLKASKVLKSKAPKIFGLAYNRRAEKLQLRRKARLAITSPPYLDVHSYAYDNRARLWFLDLDYNRVRKRLFSTGSLERYFDYVGRTLVHFSKSMMHDSTLVLVLGDVRRENGRVLAVGESFAEYWLNHHSKCMKLKCIITDKIRPTRRRYFNLEKSEGIKCERILIFGKGRPTCNKTSIDWNAKY